VKCKNQTSIKSLGPQNRNSGTTTICLHSFETDLSDAKNCFVCYALWDCCLAGDACLLECLIQLCLDFLPLYVIISACVVMLHMGCPIGALFVQSHNWTAVIWLPASAKATAYCPYLPAAAADVCIQFSFCTCVCVCVCVCQMHLHLKEARRYHPMWSLKEIGHQWAFLLSHKDGLCMCTHKSMYTQMGECFQINEISVPFIGCYQLTSLHNWPNTSTQLISK